MRSTNTEKTGSAIEQNAKQIKSTKHNHPSKNITKQQRKRLLRRDFIERNALARFYEFGVICGAAEVLPIKIRCDITTNDAVCLRVGEWRGGYKKWHFNTWVCAVDSEILESFSFI